MSPTTRLGTSTTPTRDPLKRGFFTKGQWHCNCQPRLPAVQFQVRRESKNKGRWFYTCQKDRTKGVPGQPDKCDFFLWAEDARLREEGALLGRRRAEPPTPTQKRMRQTTLSATVTPRAAAEKRAAGPTPVVPLSELERQVGGGPAAASSPAASSATVRAGGSGRTQSTLREIDVETDSDDSSSDDTSEDELAPGPTTAAAAAAPRDGPPQAGDKRKRGEEEEEEEEDDDDDDYSDWSSDEEQQVAAITDSSSRGPGAQGRKRDAFATPAAARTHDVAAGLPTPSFTGKPLRRVLFTEPEAPTPRKRQRTTESTDSDPDSDAVLPTSNPPNAAQPQMPSAAAAVATTPGGGPGVTAVVMGLLRDQQVDSAVRARVRQELERSSARARGLERGRDAARQAVRELEARAAQQQQRIVALENERHLHAEARDKMRTRLMKLCSED